MTDGNEQPSIPGGGDDDRLSAEGAADRAHTAIIAVEAVVTSYVERIGELFTALQTLSKGFGDAGKPAVEAIQECERARQGEFESMRRLLSQARADSHYAGYEVALLRRQVEERDRMIARLSGGSTQP